jgi:hypothetical protein
MPRSFKHGCRLNSLVEGLLDVKWQPFVIQFPCFSVEGKFENFLQKGSCPTDVLVIEVFNTAGLGVLTLLPGMFYLKKIILDVNCTQAGRFSNRNCAVNEERLNERLNPLYQLFDPCNHTRSLLVAFNCTTLVVIMLLCFRLQTPNGTSKWLVNF